MSVTALRTVRQNRQVTEPVNECPICGGENGKHQPVRVPYPWPLNLSVFKYVPCPVEEAGG